MTQPYHPNYLPPNFGPKKDFKPTYHSHTCTSVFTAALSTTAKLWDQTKHPEWRNGRANVVYVHCWLFLVIMKKKNVICRKMNITGDHHTKQIK